MRISYKEKIDKINADRILMLNMVKENISKDNTTLSEGLEITTAALDLDEQNTKEYTAIVTAKQLIFELTQEIANATDVEEIISLRKKVNYYINKIKKELMKRNISQEQFDKIYSDVSYLRGNIAMYLRFLKRENNILEITNLYENVDNLSDESSMRLKKLLNNELRYNKRILNSKTNDGEKRDNNNGNVTGSLPEANESSNDDLKDVSQQGDLILDFNELVQQMGDKDTSMDEDLTLYSTLDPTYLTQRLEYYKSQYNFKKLLGYDESFFKNFINLFRNIPRYRKNRRVIKAVERDYNIFYHGQDLGALLDYSKKRNSIFTALSAIFRSSRLSKRELECLYNHEKCKDWIIEFYKPKDDMLEGRRRVIRVR